MIVKKEDLLKCIKEHPDATQKELSEIMGVSYYTIIESIKAYDIHWERKGRYRNKKISEENLRDYIERHPKATQKDIADYFDVSISTINDKIKQFGIQWKKKNTNHNMTELKVSKQDLEDFLSENPGIYQWQIAKHFNISESTLRIHMKRYGIIASSRKPGKRDAVPEEELRDYIEKHPEMYQWQIARNFEVNTSTINKYIKEYGLKWKTPRDTKSKKVLASREETIQKIIKFLKVNPKATPEELEMLFRLRTKTEIEVRRLLEEKKEELLQEGKKDKAIFIQSLLNRGQKKKDNEKDER